MHAIFDAEGNELATVPLTAKQQTVLEAGGSIAVLWHTPQLLQAELGKRSGSFHLHLEDGRLVTTTPGSVKEYAVLRAAIDQLKAPPDA